MHKPLLFVGMILTARCGNIGDTLQIRIDVQIAAISGLATVITVFKQVESHSAYSNGPLTRDAVLKKSDIYFKLSDCRASCYECGGFVQE